MRSINGELAKLTPNKYEKLNTVGFFGSAQSSTFLPTDVSGLKVWLDASDASTITKDGSDLVSQWDDKSGEGNDIAQATGSLQPLWVDSVQNSKPIIRGDGIDNTIGRATYTGGAEAQINTILIVCKMSADVHGIYNSYMFDSGNSSYRHLFTTWNPTDIHLMFAGTILDSTSIDTSFHVYTLEYNSTSSIMRQDKSQLTTGDASTQGMQGLTFFSGFNGGQTGNGDIGEFLFYNKQLSTAERDNLEDYLTDKWGL